jgi:hypothetical protein
MLGPHRSDARKMIGGKVMMHRKMSLVTLAVTALCVSGALAAANKSATSKMSVTVGEFATQVARALGQEVAGQKEAVESLRGMGVNLGADLGAPLNEAAVARMAADLGIVMAPPADPEGTVSAAKSGQIAAAFGAAHLESKPIGSQAPPPTQCLSSANRGACVNCCKTAGLGGQYCGHFCHANVAPPPSPGEQVP